MKYELTAKRIRLALELNNMKAQDLAEKSGVKKASISQYVNGSHSPSNMSSGKMAPVLGVDPLWLMGFDVPMKKEPEANNVHNSTGIMIPVYGHVAAGEPIDANQDIVGYEKISPDLARRGEFYALTIKGDSMTPMICDGDTIIVREQPDAESGEIVVATINGDDATCKRLRKYAGGLELSSINPVYEPYTFSSEDIESIPVRILGKVVEMRRRFT